MASPTPITLTDIVNEGLGKAGYATPTTSLIIRATDQWMAEVKTDIFQKIKKPMFLQAEAIQILANGLSKYSMPADFSSLIAMQVMAGTIIGTAQAGGDTTITLASDSTMGETDILGKEILIYEGTGINGLRQITGYNTTTKIATVASAWTANPIIGDKYMIISLYTPLQESSLNEYSQLTHPEIAGVPSHYVPIGDADNGEFFIYPVPYDADTPFGLKIRYYADVLELDLDSTLFGTLLKRWRNVFVQGINFKALQNIKDERYPTELSLYRQMLEELEMRETYGMDLSNLTMRVVDY